MKNYGLLGNNINYSLSPLLHNTIFKKLNIDAQYSLIDTADKKEIKNILKNMKLDKLQGLNVTIPYKQEIIFLLDRLTPQAKNIGAINTIYKENSCLTGDNTDYTGFLETIKKMNLNLKNKNVGILGSGGSAKAVLQVIIDLKGIPYIVSRNKESTQKKYKKCQVINYKDLEALKGELLVNCTPLGNKNYPNLSPVSKTICKNWNYGIDLNYIPEISLFLSYFKENNRINGLYMLVSQGIKSENIWQNKNISTDEIYDIIYKDVYNK